MHFISKVREIELLLLSPVHRKETARHGWAENGLAEVLRPANKVCCRKVYAQTGFLSSVLPYFKYEVLRPKRHTL